MRNWLRAQIGLQFLGGRTLLLAVLLVSSACTQNTPSSSRRQAAQDFEPLQSVSASEAAGDNQSAPVSRNLRDLSSLRTDDLDRWAQDLGLWPIREPSQRRVKIAILDNGFAGAAEQIGRNLPSRTQIRPGPVPVDPKSEDVHGTKMAEILAGLLDRGGVDYELHLFSAFGYSNLKAATETVVREDFQLVLYAQVWEYGGNGDGRGFINALVTPVVQAGIIWVNAAGNFNQLMYRGRVERAFDDWASLPSPNQSVRVRCERTPTGKCPLRAVLAWNDFKDDVRTGTLKDLDLVLTDDTTRVLQTAGLRQRQTSEASAPGTSLYPREILEAELTPGLYHLRVKLRSTDWTEQDELRISLQGEGLRLLDASVGESLLAPADHPDVIVVGASDSDRSSFSQRLGRPDLTLASLIRTESGQAYKGSSNAAAAAVARLAGLFSKLNVNVAWPRTRDEARALWSRSGAHRLSPPSRPQPGRPVEFAPTHPLGCYQLITLQTRLGFLNLFFQAGGHYVATSLGPKLLVPADPWQILSQAGVSVPGQGDMLIAHKTGLQRLPLERRLSLPGDVLEVVQAPRHARICRF